MKTSDILLTRQTLFNNVDFLLDKIGSYKEETKTNSFDLFGDDDQVQDTLRLAPATTINQLNVLLKEKEFLGLYVTNNPIEQFSPVLSYIKNVSEKDNIYLILIDKIKKIFTKNKDMMFALELSIDGDKVEGVIFPKYAMQLSPLLEEKKLFFATGRISIPKKRKQEVVVSDEGEFSSEDGNQVQEFVELPKLLIDNLAGFEKGVTSLFVKEEDKISNQRMDILKAIDFVGIMTDPDNFKKYFNNSQPDIIELETVKIELPNTLPKSQALQIKKLLQSSGLKEIIIELYVQLPTGEYKQSKSNYEVSKIVYDEILSYLELKKD
jgi:hypothetical protein